MQAISVRGLWAGLLAAGVLGAAAIAFTGSASADQERAPNAGATIKIKLDQGGPFFAGPNSVGSGEKLEIVNRTDPMEIGPHTFTLVKRSLIDQGREQRRCEQLESRLCRRVFRAHEIDPKTFAVGEPVVDNGENGWDRKFSKKRKGDSWFTEAQGEDHVRKVRAEPGKTLAYFCIVHPFMQDTIEVTD